MYSISQSFFNQLTTPRAHLTRVARIHKNHSPTSFCRFVGRELYELIPRYVSNAFIKFMPKNLSMIAHHAVYVQFFKGDDLIGFN